MRVEVNMPRNHLGDVALIQRRNKDLAENQSGSSVKLIRLVLRPVGFDDSKWQTYLVGNKSIRFLEYMKLVLTLKITQNGGQTVVKRVMATQPVTKPVKLVL